MDVLLWLAIGAAIGWLASRVGRGPGTFVNVAAGLGGAAIGGWLIGRAGVRPLDAAPAVRAVAGAVVLLGVLHLGRRRRRPRA